MTLLDTIFRQNFLVDLKPATSSTEAAKKEEALEIKLKWVDKEIRR